MIDFKSLGMAFGGMAIVAGLSYLSRRSSGSRVEVLRTYEDDDAIEHLSQRTGITDRDKLADALRDVRKEIHDNRENPQTVLAGAQLPAYSDEEVEKALGFASKVYKKGVSHPIQRGFGAIKKLRKAELRALTGTPLLSEQGRMTHDAPWRPDDLVIDAWAKDDLVPAYGNWRKAAKQEGERVDYLDNEDAVDALLDLEKILDEHVERPYTSDRAPLALGVVCGSENLDPKECAQIVGRLRDSIDALPSRNNRRLSPFLRFLAERGDPRAASFSNTPEHYEKLRKKTVDILRSGARHSHWSNLVSVLRALNGWDNGPPEDLLAMLDEASKLPPGIAPRVGAAIAIEMNPMFSEMLWPEEVPLAPSYPDLYREDAARVARGEPIQKVFEPVPLQEARKYWKGPSVRSGGREQVFRSYLRDACPDFRDEVYRERLFESVKNSPRMRKWLASMCADDDKSRFSAFVAKREFPSAPGEKRESSYLREIVDLLSTVKAPPEVSSPKDSPRSFEKKLRAVKAMEDLVRYQKVSDEREAPVPDWWPEDTVSELRAQGVRLRLLRTCRDIVKEGIDLDNCARNPDIYCPSVQRGQAVLVSMQIDPQFDEEGRVRLPGHRSLLEFATRTGYSSGTPLLRQYEGYRGMRVENPRSIAATNALLEGIRRAIARKG